MFEIKIDVDVPAEGFLTDATRQTVADDADRARWRIEHVRCPEHGTGAGPVTIVETPMGGRTLRFTRDPCCEKLSAAIERAARDV